MKYKIYDCRNLGANEIVDYLVELYPFLECKANRKNVYIGATGNVDDRLRRHNAGPGEFLFCAKTAHRNVAAKVEEIAGGLGFEIGKVQHGGNGTNSFSIYVYAYMITRNTKE